MAILNTLYAGQGVSSSGGTISGDLTIEGDLSVEGGGSFTYDEMVAGDMRIIKTLGGVVTATNRGLLIDVDQNAVIASGQTATNIGLDIDINSDGKTMVGTVNSTGIDIDILRLNQKYMMYLFLEVQSVSH